MLHNPFYVGLIRIKRTGQTFDGIHEPLISKAVFDRVQAIISGRTFARPQKYAFAYRRLIRCAACGYALVAEVQKGHTYYRCHTKVCRGTSLRERDVDQAIRDCLARFAFTDEEFRDVRDLARELQAADTSAQAERRSALDRDLALCEDRLTRLTDAFLDALVDKETFEARKGQLLSKRRSLREALAAPQAEPFAERVLKILERGKAAYLGYDQALPEEKREIVRELTSHLIARQKTLEVTIRPEFQAFLEQRNFH